MLIAANRHADSPCPAVMMPCPATMLIDTGYWQLVLGFCALLDRELSVRLHRAGDIQPAS
jgi:hypothetical protein